MSKVDGATLMARRRKGDAVSGWINLDKPHDLTSTHAVARVRRAFRGSSLDARDMSSGRNDTQVIAIGAASLDARDMSSGRNVVRIWVAT